MCRQEVVLLDNEISFNEAMIDENSHFQLVVVDYLDADSFKADMHAWLFNYNVIFFQKAFQAINRKASFF